MMKNFLPTSRNFLRRRRQFLSIREFAKSERDSKSNLIRRAAKWSRDDRNVVGRSTKWIRDERNLIRRAAKIAFADHNLLYSNTLICCVMNGIGDAVVQSWQRKGFDRRRTLNLSLAGLSIGPCCHFWYLLLHRLMPGKNPVAIIKKILVDQIIFSPFCLSVFLTTLGVMQGTPWRGILDNILTKGVFLYTAEWCIWPPAQFVNFYLIPLRFRVLFDNSVSFFFDMLQSHVIFDDDDKDGEKVK